MRKKSPWPAPKPDAPPAQLYDLNNDPGEANNLYNEHPGIVQQLKVGLERIRNEENYNPVSLQQPEKTIANDELDKLFE